MTRPIRPLGPTPGRDRYPATAEDRTLLNLRQRQAKAWADEVISRGVAAGIKFRLENPGCAEVESKPSGPRRK